LVRAEARGAGEAVCRVTLASIVETKGTDLEIANSRGLASRATAAGKRATSPATARKLLNVITAASLVTIHKNARSTGEALCAIIVIRRVTLHVTAHDLGTRAEEIVSQRVSSVRSTLRSQLPLRKQ